MESFSSSSFAPHIFSIQEASSRVIVIGPVILGHNPDLLINVSSISQKLIVEDKSMKLSICANKFILNRDRDNGFTTISPMRIVIFMWNSIFTLIVSLSLKTPLRQIHGSRRTKSSKIIFLKYYFYIHTDIVCQNVKFYTFFFKYYTRRYLSEFLFNILV